MISTKQFIAYGRRAGARPLRFIFVGGLATLTHLTVATLIVLAAPAGSPYQANLCAFLAAFVVSYAGHRYFTFATHGSVVRFLVVSIGGFLLNNVILALGLQWRLSSIPALLIATLSVPMLTYIISCLWVFKESPKSGVTRKNDQ